MEKTDFIEMIMTCRSGQVASDLSAKFNSVLEAVLDTGGKGKMTICLDIVPAKFGQGGAVVEIDISHDVKLKKPELDIGKSIFFVDKSGRLTREDPAQADMFQDLTKEQEKAK